ncbi:LysR substrate-binding domain-containing protein [Sphingomonas sp.]|uniref:LysR substrate-binding domain-containing protein n=1 Tax=Sphingomonas sp. TaxID=28214 RepID=UPI001D340BE9|nr:LysR substrate-binding domain-containing protein [Sphingomonas sp.]MBX9797766.1 LysR family transcriptional regulator [Sphingomonas sp.]
MTIPSLQSLRALEAAVRLESYSAAARELGLTHSAISHRVRELEARLGVRLFERQGQRMIPSARARALAEPVAQALALLAETFPAAQPARQPLRVSVLPSFAHRWLVPRLPAFRAAHPGIDLQLDARLELAAPGQRGIDAGLRYGGGAWPGLVATRLAGERLFPVWAPAYAERLGLATPADLARATLLRHLRQHWQPWFAAAGVALAEPRNGPMYEDAGLLLEAAAAGEGVALARGLLVARDLAAGRLVAPFAIAVDDQSAYYLVRPAAPRRANAAADMLAGWIRATLAAEQAPPP